MLLVDDPAFRGYWNGTIKLFFNALVFGVANNNREI